MDNNTVVVINREWLQGLFWVIAAWVAVSWLGWIFDSWERRKVENMMWNLEVRRDEQEIKKIKAEADAALKARLEAAEARKKSDDFWRSQAERDWKQLKAKLEKEGQYAAEKTNRKGN
jgi:hypothetical protein